MGSLRHTDIAQAIPQCQKTLRFFPNSRTNQAKAALLFLDREVLEQNSPWPQNVEQAKVPKRLPV
jgi:hypothetical protein